MSGRTLAAFALAMLSARVDAEPPLAHGVAWSAALGGGMSHSPLSTTLALDETASLGGFIYSSERHALSLEAVENFALALDRTTPQYGYLAAALRAVEAPEDPLVGAPGTTTTFQRFALGPAYLFDGNRFELGLAADATLAYLVHKNSGVALDIGAYFYDSSIAGRNTLFLVGISYVVSPLVDMPRHAVPEWRPGERPHVEPDETEGPCKDPAVYQNALREHRKRFLEACADYRPECQTERTTISALDAKLKSCSEAGSGAEGSGDAP
jgi:hypothetical protein